MSPVAVIGDVHGCATELEQLLRSLPEPDILLLGDLYTKGPDPVGVYRLIQEYELRAVLGNHDLRLIERLDGKRAEDSHAAEVIERLDAGASGWRTHLRRIPRAARAGPFLAVHAGLPPSGDPEGLPLRQHVNLRRWPAEKLGDPRWTEVYDGSRPVVFGHDARRGLVRIERAGQPFLIGLDTGCVYGGSLSAYRVEEDAIEQVPARRVWWDPQLGQPTWR